MPQKLRATGIGFAIVFAIALALTTVQGALKGIGPLALIFRSQTIVLLIAIIGFILSAFIRPLRWFQPIVFLACMPFPIMGPEGTTNMYALGFFAIGVLLLERAGFFNKHRLPKAIGAILYLFGWELAAVFTSGANFTFAITPVFFILAFLFFLWILYRDRMIVYLKEPKPRLSLTEKGLSPAEQSYVIAVSQGRQPKEIAFDFEVSESTVRNTLARAYKKLEVEDKASMAALLASHELVEGKLEA